MSTAPAHPDSRTARPATGARITDIDAARPAHRRRAPVGRGGDPGAGAIAIPRGRAARPTTPQHPVNATPSAQRPPSPQPATGSRPLPPAHPNPSIPGAGAAAGAGAPAATPPAAPQRPPVGSGGAGQNTTAREARGFVLYVGLDEAKAKLDNTTLTKLVEALKRVTSEVAPHAETYAAVALAPKGTGGRDVDVVRLALGEPQALAEYYGTSPEQEQPTGVTIDTTRRRVLLGGENVGLTYKEFELLQALVLREGRTVDRAEIIDTLWRDAPDERPNDRTIDVHVRRLRSKLGPYADIVRTVRGTGYRFDRHADVEVLYSMAHSPDRF